MGAKKKKTLIVKINNILKHYFKSKLKQKNHDKQNIKLLHKAKYNLFFPSPQASHRTESRQINWRMQYSNESE